MKAAIIAIFSCLAIAGFAATPAVGPWSEVAQGIRGRLAVDFGPDLAGAEMAVVYLEIQNVSDVANPKELWFDPGRSLVEWNLQDEQGRKIPKPGGIVASIMMMGPYWITLPHDATLRFRASVSGYGIQPNGGIAFQLPGAFWQVARQPGVTYELSATFVSSPPKGDIRHAWRGRLLLPSVKIPDRK
jgi:hypothetical protein